MGLQLILGAGGTGKSTYIYENITKEASVRKDKRYFVIVPDQFTMQTQADMVSLSKGGGIMNIDVLSFSRLAHRVFEETNCENKTVLDDTGKSLVLRKIAGDIADRIPYISGNMKRAGFIHEVKSSVSEFMQYDLSPKEVGMLADYSEGKGALKAKLNDLTVIYEQFLRFLGDRYITNEGSMGLLARMLDSSELIAGSVVVFDGFTGFTPIQLKVLGRLMKLCEEIYITLTLEKTGSGSSNGDLFTLTAKSMDALVKTAKEAGIEVKEPIYLEHVHRFEGKADLAHLERHIFRYPTAVYDGLCERISLYEAKNIEDEVTHLAIDIGNLTRNGAEYREIAVVTGNMPEYENHINRIFRYFSIPTYIDKTRAIVLNPFVEYTESLLALVNKNFEPDSVVRFLRSGLGGFDEEKVDIFENHLLKKGMRGSRYKEFWPADDETVEPINEIREAILTAVEPLLAAGIRQGKSLPASVFVKALYDCYTSGHVFEGLEEYRKRFEEEADFTKEKEYSQIYRLSMGLLEQIYGLLGEESITLEDFSQILEAGFEEITVGTIPQSVDRVIVGDMERSRLKPVKYLFFIGVNDGAIPKNNSSCSIISDMEREFLAGMKDIELAPTPRQKMYIQRFYLYNNLVKPSEKLYISYSLMNNDGESARPAYIVHTLKDMFSRLKTGCRGTDRLADIYNVSDLKSLLCDLMRDYAAGADNSKLIVSAIDSLFSLGEEGERAWMEAMIENAFFTYKDDRLKGIIAGILYGENMLAGVSRMERFAGCAYSYFLSYGLSLKERERYGIDNRDTGTLLHLVLQGYADHADKNGLKWYEIDEETSEKIIDDVIENVLSDNNIFWENSTNGYILTHLKKTLCRAVDTLSYQLKSGKFNVSGTEIPFTRYRSIDEINEAYDKQEKMQVKGRIDRLDTCETDDRLYVKVVDYKTGTKDFSLINFYHGLQLQLVVYLDECMKEAEKTHKDKEIVPAALLYYRVGDSTVDAESSDSEEDIKKKVYESLRTKGIVSDDMDVIEALAGVKEGKSDVIPVNIKNGAFSKGSSVLNREDIELLCKYAEYKLRSIGNDIITGKITKNPVEEENGKKTSCKYCEYRNVCGFEQRLDGYSMKKIVKEDDDVIMDKIRKELEEE